MTLLVSRIIVSVVIIYCTLYALKYTWTHNMDPREWLKKPVTALLPEVKHNDGGNLTINQYNLIYETTCDLSKAKKDVSVLENNIVDAYKGYMRIRVSKEFLNTNFNIPVTLKYESASYEPVMLTFQNVPIKGAGIIITSPEREKNTSIYLNESFIKYKGFGPQTYTEDLVFKMYYNENHVFVVTESAEIQFLNLPPGSSYKPPPIRYGRNIIVGYFEENGIHKKYDPSEVDALEQYFKTYRSQ